ncbi:MAG: zf-HC2 domain-containing protein [Oscillospiraceae bacterium]|nr:zf-HC2 domain-containing protein [Oscillospiraceae bacterium]
MADCREWMEEISASLDGELSPEEEAALQAHLAECEDCRAAMALLRGMSQVMREDTVQPPAQLAEGTRFLFEREKKEKGFSLKRWRFTAIAAVICLALFGVVKLAPWSMGGSTAAAPMAAEGITAQESVKDASSAPAGIQAAKDYLTAAGSMEPAPESAEGPGEEPAAEEDMRGAPTAIAAATNGMVQEDAGMADDYLEEEKNAAANGALPGSSPLYTAESLPGYAIYSQLEGADTYYSVCFTYGEVPESIRTNRECTPLDAPEGQERWLVPLSVCMNEGLLEQFSEIYYGDLLSRQGLVIGILDMEEDQWQP